MNNELEYVKCVICESNNYDIIYKSSNLNLVLCKNCSLGYLNPRWTKKQYDNYYKTHYDEEYRPDLLNKDNNLDIKSLNVITERFKKNNQIYTNSKLILDIGSGGGENLLAFKNLYPQLECYAIEPSLSSREVLKQRNINIISDDVDSNWHLEYKTKFDIIIMRHVLEHFLNPLDVLKKVYNTLSDDGVLYIAVPNNLLEIRNEGWLRIAHTYYFNQYTLTAILNKASLKIKTIGLKDEFNKFEVFAFVEKDTNSIDSSFISNNSTYKIQKKSFRKALSDKKEIFVQNLFFKKILDKLKRLCITLINKM